MNIEPYQFHIESLDRAIYQDLLANNNFVSGHVSYTYINQIVDLNEWVKVATFRDPVDYTISHLKWVRRLADKGEEERFNKHPAVFQKIAKEMLDYDFSQASEITRFIRWVESIGFSYFHNTQMLYLNSDKDGFIPTHEQVEVALDNLSAIDFVGIQEDLDGFMSLLRYEMNWKLDQNPRINTNENNYGFNKADEATIASLKPLYEKDMIIYRHAKAKYEKLLESYSKEGIDYNPKIRIDTYTLSNIRGWARFENNLRKVEFEVVSDSKVVGSFIANDFRADLKRKNIHPSGCCGFNVDLSKYHNEGELQIRVKHNNDLILTYPQRSRL